jgi:hypothetical protein
VAPVAELVLSMMAAASRPTAGTHDLTRFGIEFPLA